MNPLNPQYLFNFQSNLVQPQSMKTESSEPKHCQLLLPSPRAYRMIP